MVRNRWLVFLGDVIDAGPDTAGTINLLLDWQKQHPQTTCIAGNHEMNLAAALGLIQSPFQRFYWNRIPSRNRQILTSYGATNAQELAEKMPASHKEFFRNLPWCVEHPDYLFVHAGLDAREPYEEQIAKLRQRDTSAFKPKWLYDDRLAFCVPQDSHKTIVSGHTILRQPLVAERRILLDCGCGYGGSLTAILLPERLLIQVPPAISSAI